MSQSNITLDQLSHYFHLPEKQVAQELGICLTSLKKICRARGVMRWPFRKLRRLQRTLKKVGNDTDSLSIMTSGRDLSPVPMAEAIDRSPSCQSGSPAPSVHGSTQASCEPAEAEQQVEGSLSDLWPTCTISGAHMHQLIVHNWSTLWTVHQMRRRLLTALGGKDLTISPDGIKAYLVYTSSLAAMQAKAVCEQACELLRERAGSAGEARGASLEEAAKAAEVAAEPQQPMTLMSMVEPGAGVELEGFLAQTHSKPLSGEGFDGIGHHDQEPSEFSHCVSPPETSLTSNLFDPVSHPCGFSFQFL